MSFLQKIQANNDKSEAAQEWVNYHRQQLERLVKKIKGGKLTPQLDNDIADLQRNIAHLLEKYKKMDLKVE